MTKNTQGRSVRKLATKANGRHSSVSRVPREAIGHPTVVQLYVKAGGRCEFTGCAKDLMQHTVTRQAGNFGEIGHIVAYRSDGPRGRMGTRPIDIHDINNLMLLCAECHKLVDDRPDEYTIHVLKACKQLHEDDISHAADLTQTRTLRTSILRLTCPIRCEPTTIPIGLTRTAIRPRVPHSRECNIDLANLKGVPEADSTSTIQKAIASQVEEFLRPSRVENHVEHLSVFGLAPIPSLVFLGFQLGNLMPTDIYHHHHDTDDWTWKDEMKHIQYTWWRVRHGVDSTAVALLLSCSGTVAPESLPHEFDGRFAIYEIRTERCEPSTNALRTRQGLENFKRTYEEFLRMVRRVHPGLKTLHLFPAIPPPIAILCGRELMPKVDPTLRIYDYDKHNGGFCFRLEVNTND